ncbi:MAG: M20 family metallopeptidase [Candidatus Bathyarchaeia archaeon]
MISITKLKEEVAEEVNKIRDRMVELSDKIHGNPELSFEEFKASKWLASELEEHGFNVQIGIANLETAFKATYRVAGEKPIICLMVEYDALPDIGHACGHHMSGVASVTAAIALSKVMQRYGLDGSIVALGTPGEELYAGKIPLIKAGAFDGVDAAMMVHAADKNVLRSSLLALDALQFDFKGKPAHASAAPHMGINALNAVLLTFRAIDALRQHVRSDVRIHGIITEGGKAPNIVPEKASARFYVRSTERWYLDEVTEKVKNCARGAALATGASLEIISFEPSMDDMINNTTLCELFRKNWAQFTTDILDQEEPLGSSDVGNVSHVVPAIQPEISIAPEGTTPHTREFAEAGISEKAHQAIVIAAKTMSMTAIDLLSIPEIVDKIRQDFSQSLRSK